tara:strand:- start:3152 stop:3298 length:147 start_codon:yes stop_codon:yes gene_type:complete
MRKEDKTKKSSKKHEKARILDSNCQIYLPTKDANNAKFSLEEVVVSDP